MVTNEERKPEQKRKHSIIHEWIDNWWHSLPFKEQYKIFTKNKRR